MTDNEKLINCYAHLQKFFNPNPKPTKEYYEKWIEIMGKYSVEHVAFAVDHIEKTTGKMPTVSECLTAVDSIDFNAKKVLYEKEKIKAEQDAKAFFSGETVKGIGRKYLELIFDGMTDKCTRGEYLTRLRLLSGQKSFPKLEASFKGKDMDEPLGSN